MIIQLTCIKSPIISRLSKGLRGFDMSTIVGYARVSSVGQSLDIQVAALKAEGCTKVFSDKLTGTTAQRPDFQALRNWVREGDVVVACKMDRLSRSLRDLLSFIDEMKSKKVEVKILNCGVDTTTSTGKLMLQMLGAVAEFENELRAERQAEGIKAALKNGVKFGRPRALDDAQILELKALKARGDLGMKEIARRLNISIPTAYRLLRL